MPSIRRWAGVVAAWFTIFPVADWAYYLLAVTTAALALWIAWRLSARFLDGEKRVVGLALLTLVPFFNFHALKFNQNTVLLPLWAGTTLFFLRSFETRNMLDAALAGVLAAAAIYGKYWSAMLLLGLGIAALTDPRRDAYFRSPAPWVTIAAGALVLAPHVAWLVANNFVPFSYAFATHSATSMSAVALSTLTYLLGAFAYVAVPVILALVALRPDRAAAYDMLWPATPERRLAVVAFWAPLLVPIVVALAARFPLTSLWTMSAWTLLPVVLLSSPLTELKERFAPVIVAAAVIVPFVMIAAAPGVAYWVHRTGVVPGAAHASELAKWVELVWDRAATTAAAAVRRLGGFRLWRRFLSALTPAGGERARRHPAVRSRRADRALWHRHGLSRAGDKLRRCCDAAGVARLGRPAHRGGDHAPLFRHARGTRALRDRDDRAAGLSRARRLLGYVIAVLIRQVKRRF